MCYEPKLLAVEYMVFLPLQNQAYFCYKTVNLTVILNLTGVKITMNYENDSIVGVILPVENKILPIVNLKLKLTKTLPLFYTFCQKHSGCVYASGKNGSTPSRRDVGQQNNTLILSCLTMRSSITFHKRASKICF